MKVLLFANTEWYLYNFRLALARALRAAGTEVVLISPEGPYGGRLVAEGFRWLPLPMERRSLNPLRELRLLLHLVRLYRRERPDVVHHFTIKCVVYGTLAARLAGTSGIVNAVTGLGHVFTDKRMRSRMLRPFVAGLLRSCLGGGNGRLILQNPDDQEAFHRGRLAPMQSVRLIRSSGVSTERFVPVGQRSARGPVRILLATRLLREKGVVEFVEAARCLSGEGASVEFLLAGRPDPGNPSSVSQKVIDGWHSEGIVRALGHVETMHELLREVDMVVLPSYREGTPKILLEAAACGLPIIATDVPGCREIVSHGENGLLVPPRDSTSLAAAIRLLVDQPETRARMGAAGRKKVLAEFDERIVIKRTLDVYRELVSIPG